MGLSNRAIARRLGVSCPTVSTVRNRFAKEGVDGLLNRRPRIRTRAVHSTELEARILATTVDLPSDGRPWSTRRLARHLKTSRMMVHRVWRQAGIDPNHRRKPAILEDSQFLASIRDIVGIYVSSPGRIAVLQTGRARLSRQPPSLHHNAHQDFTWVKGLIAGVAEPSVVSSHQDERNFRILFNRVRKLVTRQQGLCVLTANETREQRHLLDHWIGLIGQSNVRVLPVATTQVWTTCVSELLELTLQRHTLAACELAGATLVHAIRQKTRAVPFIWAAGLDHRSPIDIPS
jgi:transposase